MLHATYCSGVTLQPNTSSDTVLETSSITVPLKKKQQQKAAGFTVQIWQKNHPAAVQLRLEKYINHMDKISSSSCLLSYQQRPKGRNPEGFVGKGTRGGGGSSSRYQH